MTSQPATFAFMAHSLWIQQESDEDLAAVAINACGETITSAIDEFGEERLLVAGRTGFSLSSAELLRSLLSPHSSLFSSTSSRQMSTEELMGILLEASLALPEVRKGYLGRDVDWKVHLEPLTSWISGDEYQAIHRKAIHAGALKENSKIGEAVKYCADMSTWLSWGFGACYSVLQSIVDPVDDWVGLLPLLTKYGVPSKTAAYLSLLGVSDRIATQRLADQFKRAAKPESIEEIAEWMKSVDLQLEDIFPESNLRGQLLRRQVFPWKREQLPYVFVRAIASRDLSPGDILSFSVEGDHVWMHLPGTIRIGLVVDPEVMLSFAGRAPTQVSGVVVSSRKAPSREDWNVSVAVIRNSLEESTTSRHQ